MNRYTHASPHSSGSVSDQFQLLQTGNATMTENVPSKPNVLALVVSAGMLFVSQDLVTMSQGWWGSCKALLFRWTFTEERGCYQFNYRGCGGNQNNFETKLQCEEICVNV